MILLFCFFLISKVNEQIAKLLYQKLNDRAGYVCQKKILFIININND